MKDPRFARLCNMLVKYSLNVQPGEKTFIEAFDIPPDFTSELIQAIVDAGGLPFVSTYQSPVLRALYRNASEEQMRLIGEVEKSRMEGMQGYIGVRGTHNLSELSDVPAEKMELYERLWWHPVHSEIRVPKTKWVVLRWPHPSMAQAANMSTESFEDFYFRVCTEVDYDRMAQAAQPLKELLEKTDRVRITGKDTELEFSIKGIPAIPCSGKCNIPDGELFTCPVKESVNGYITFNTETLYRGRIFSGIRLEFVNGKIIHADAGAMTNELNAILDSDKGARYIGEWSLAYNPEILKPMKDILFDEKIAGSFHLTPGQAYDDADNGNRSQIHWDMVKIQRPEYGGGCIYLDGVMIRENGRFTLPELDGLNPENLGGISSKI